MRITIDSATAMEQFGARIAEHLEAGDLIALNGELGAGKTTLVRGIGEALGARGSIASPTFVIARTHPTERGVPLVHVDAYRLGSAAELDDLDLDFEASIVAVEWAAGMLDGVAESWLEVGIERPRGGQDAVSGPPDVGGPSEVGGSLAFDETDEVSEPRTVTLTGHGPRWAALVLGLESELRLDQ